MRPILSPGTRARRLVARVTRPPAAVRQAVWRWDYRREERRTAREIAAQEGGPGTVDGLPVPPPLLRVRVTGGWAEPATWLATGATDAELIRATLTRSGSSLEEMKAFLDFGCGCGRVSRHWAGLRGPIPHGSDVSRPAVRWCRRNLHFMQTTRCDPEPPLPYGDSYFDFVYALSVFTHLTEDSGRRWLAELVRILKPGGLLLFTVHGERFAHELDETDSRRLREGEFVIAERPAAQSGSNYFASFHSPRYVRDRLLPTTNVELLEVLDEDPAGGVPTPMTLQDNYLVRKRQQGSG
jgi:SAM-dependent methyltransferase